MPAFENLELSKARADLPPPSSCFQQRVALIEEQRSTLNKQNAEIKEGMTQIQSHSKELQAAQSRTEEIARMMKENQRMLEGIGFAGSKPPTGTADFAPQPLAVVEPGSQAGPLAAAAALSSGPPPSSSSSSRRPPSAAAPAAADRQDPRWRAKKPTGGGGGGGHPL